MADNHDDISASFVRALGVQNQPTPAQVGEADRTGLTGTAVKLEPQRASLIKAQNTVGANTLFNGMSKETLDFLNANPDNMAAVADDLRGDEPALPRYLNAVKNVAGDIALSAAMAGPATAEAVYGTGELGARSIGAFGEAIGIGDGGYNQVADLLQRDRGRIRSIREWLDGKRTHRTFVGDAAASGIQSMVQMAPGLAMSVITRNPSYMAGYASMQTFGSTVGSDLDKNIPLWRTALHGATDASVEFLMERIPVAKLIEDIGGGASFSKMLGRQLLAENLTEVPTTLLQNFNEWIYANPDKPMAEFLNEQPPAIIQTIIATTVATGAQTGLVRGAMRLSGERQPTQAENTEAAVRAINDAARNTTLGRAAPDRARQLAQTVTKDENFYIPPAEALHMLEQLPAEAREGLLKNNPDLPQQIAEAEAGAVDLSIPKADYIAYVAPHAVAEDVAAFIKTNPGDISMGQQQQVREFLAANPDLLEAEIKVPDAPEDMTIGQVTEAVREAMVAAGRSQAEAKQFAPLFAAGVGQFSNAFGMTAQDALLQKGITFSSEDSTGRKVKSASPMQGLINDLRKYRADVAEGKDTRINDERKNALEDLWRKLEGRGMQVEALASMTTEEFQTAFYGAENAPQSTVNPRDVVAQGYTQLQQPNTDNVDNPDNLDNRDNAQTITVGMSPAPDPTRPETVIPAMKELLDRWREGDAAAGRAMLDYAGNHLRTLFADLPSVQVAIGDAVGVFEVAEPSIPTTISFLPEDREAVVNRLARFAHNFNQNSFHVREQVEDAPGTEYNDGSYASPGYRVETSRPLTVDEVQQIANEAGLYGMTITSNSAEFYYVGDPTDEASISSFLEAAHNAIELIASATGDDRAANATTNRLWVYGHTADPENRVIGYEAVGGDLSQSPAGQADQADHGAFILQSYFGGEAPRVALQARSITPEQRALQSNIADLYTRLPELGLDTEIDGVKTVRMAYEAAAAAIVEQYKTMGLKVIIGASRNENGKLVPRDKYGGVASAFRSDIRNNNQVEIFPTLPGSFGQAGKDYSGHPFLRKTGVYAVDLDGKPYELNVNDMLRAVHDVIAHNLAPNSTGPLGEEAAWRTHMSTISDPWARWAITTETRGQNSWVNFDPVNAAKKWGDEKNPKQFADQKTALLPLDYVYTGDAFVDAPLRELERTLTTRQKMGSLDLGARRTLYQTNEPQLASAGGFYSALAARIEGAKQTKANKADWLKKSEDGKYSGIIGGLPGAKAEEIEWSGLPEFLDAHEGPQVSREEIVAFLRQAIDVNRVGMSIESAGGRFQGYSLGNYISYDEKVIRFPALAGNFVANRGHYEMPGVMAHYRGGARNIILPDADIGTAFVIDEAQSDWDKRIAKDGIINPENVALREQYRTAALAAADRKNELQAIESAKLNDIRELLTNQFQTIADTLTEADGATHLSVDINIGGSFGEDGDTSVMISGTFTDAQGQTGKHYVESLRSINFIEETNYVEPDPSWIEEQARDFYLDEALSEIRIRELDKPPEERMSEEDMEKKAMYIALEQSKDSYINDEYSYETTYTLKSIEGLPNHFDVHITQDRYGDGWYIRLTGPDGKEEIKELSHRNDFDDVMQNVENMLSEMDSDIIFSDEGEPRKHWEYRTTLYINPQGVAEVGLYERREGDEYSWENWQDLRDQAPAAIDALRHMFGNEIGQDTLDQLADFSNAWRERKRAENVWYEANTALRNEAPSANGVPDVPFKKNGWIPLVMKSAIIDAVREGRKYVAWTKSSTQVERWQSAAQSAVRNFNWQRRAGDLSGGRSYDADIIISLTNGTAVRVFSKDSIIVGSDNERLIPNGTKLSDVVSPGIEKMIADTPDGEERKDVSGSNISIGGKGYVDVYDRQMRKAAEDIGKKYGVKVGELQTHAVRSELKNDTGLVGLWGFQIPEQMALDVARSGLPLFQKERGQISLDAMLKNVEVTLKSGANFSTVVHEFGHYMVALHRQYAQLARKEFEAGRGNRAQQRIIDDWDSVRRSVNASEDDFTIEQEEKLAKMFEAYMREGNAPSEKLRSAFARFRKWLLQIYRDVKAQLGIELNDEVRGVFDRWLASEQEIAAAAAKDSVVSAIGATMGEDIQAKIDQYLAAATADAEEKLYRRLSREASQQQRDAFQSELQAMRDEVRPEIEARPVYGVMKYMRDNGLKFIDGPEMDGLPPDLLADDGTGIMPDPVAETFGYGSGVKLIRDLRQAPDLQNAIEREARSRLRDKYPDMIESGKIKAEAFAAYTNDRTLLALDIMVKELGKRAGKNDDNLRTMMRTIARTRVQTMPMKDVQRPERYVAARDKALQQALVAAKKGDVSAAIGFTQQAMLNQTIWQEANRLTEERSNFEQMVKRINRHDKKLPNTWHPDFVYLARYILQRHGLSNTMFKAEQWIKRTMQEDPDLFDQLVSLDTAQSIPAKPLKELTVAEFRDLADAITNIIHVGRAQQSIDVAGQRIALREAVDQVTGALRAKAGKPRPSGIGELSMLRNFGDWLKDFEASLVRVESLARWIDNDNPDGAFTKYIYRPVSDAVTKSKELKTEYLQGMVELVRTRAAEYQRTKVSAPELANDKFDGKFGNKWALISALLNYGNSQNKLNLLEGYGWTEQDFMRVIERELSDADVQFVQDILDYMERIKPFVMSEYKQRTGLELPQVDAVPFTVNGITYRGGYYPLAANRDPKFDVFGGMQVDTRNMLFDRATGAQWPVTQRSFTKERTGAIYPPLLDISVAMRHVEDVMHNYATAPALMQVARIINHREIVVNPVTEVGRTIRPFVEAIGQVNPFMKNMWTPWLQAVARNTVNNIAGSDAVETATALLRGRSTMVIMGGNMLNAAQNYSSATQVIDEIGLKAWVNGEKEYLRAPNDAKKFIEERSQDMRTRYDALDRESQEVMGQLTEAAGLGRDIARTVRLYSFVLQNITDRHIAYPAWLGAYRKARDEGQSESNAVYIADRAVRTAVGAPDVKDTAAVQRGSAIKRIFTMLYGYMNMVYNRQRVSNLRLADGDINLFQWLTAHVLNMMLPNLLAAMIVDGLGGGGDAPDSEDWESWYAMRVLSGYMGMFPLIRDVGNAGLAVLFDQQMGASISNPIYSSLERGTVGTLKAFEQVAKGDGELDKVVSATIITTGLIYNLPVGFVRNPASAVADWMEGDSKPQNPAQALDHLINGPPRD